MRKLRKWKLSVVIFFLVYIITSILPATSLPVFAAAPRFGIDEYNSRQIKDSFAETGFPFQVAWSCDLKGKVNSQPIIVDGNVYVQAGKDLVKLSLADGKILGRVTVNNHELPSGSSPTYAKTTHGSRIYQATRDHRLWAIEPETLKPIWDEPLILSYDGKNYDKRYRVTASPFVYIHNNRTYIAIGTANGDGTGLPGQYKDNGFFIIQDKGFEAQVVFSGKFEGEVTGSPIFHQGMVIATENTQRAESMLIRYSPELNHYISINCKLPFCIPGSPAAEGEYIYVADREGCIYKFHNKNANEIWANPFEQGEFDFNRPHNSYNLMSPTIGSKYIYLPIRNYHSRATGGSGAVVAVDKETGLTHKVRKFNTILRSNLLYWKPSPESEQDYVFVFAYDGTAWVLDGHTLEPVPWFYDKTENRVKEVVELFPVRSGSDSPEMVIAESHLLITDGQGIMHAYKAEEPINFKAVSLEPVEQVPGEAKAGYEGGEEVQLQFTVENTSPVDYRNIPIVLTEPDGTTIPGGTIDLAAGERKTVVPWTVEVPPSDSLLYQATINPEGHPQEITAEVKPRIDNTAEVELNKKSHDIEVVSLSVETPTDAGKVQNIEAVIVNNTGSELPEVVVQWQEDSQVIREEKVSFAVGETKTLSFAWRAPDREDIINLAVLVDPAELLPDTNRANNFKEQYITVRKQVQRSCTEPLERASWDVTYNIIEGYNEKRVSYTVTERDENGNEVKKSKSKWVTDYNNPIWKPVTVTYNEALSVEVKVNTKQGIATDPKNPKESDRESRGSWAIIPYAEELSKKLGRRVDPNEITRAGYGFEVTVVTDYQNDWETKVPEGLEDTAQPIGGTFNGPKQVFAEFYDTNNRFVTAVEMERVSGSKGTGKATWKLPEKKYTFQDRTTVFERKHYTSPDIKDGDYTVLVRVEYAGKNGLYTCKQKVVKIWGSMYDDFYTAPVPRNRR